MSGVEWEDGQARLVLLDSSTSAESGGPYAADTYLYDHGDLVSEASRRYLLAERVTFEHGTHHRFEEVLVAHQSPTRRFIVPRHDVAKVMSLGAARDLILAVEP